MAEHSTLTDPELHEPKGASTASSGDVYVADGAGSGSWTTLPTKGYYVIAAYANDISQVETVYLAIPKAGTVVRCATVLMGALSGADLGVTVANSAAATMGTITITQSGSAAGDVNAVAPSSNNTVSTDDFITITGDGAPTSHTEVMMSVLIEYDL